MSLVQRLSLIAGPGLWTVAAIVLFFDIDRGSNRWYDSWVEGALMLGGVGFLIIALQTSARIVSTRYHRLGTVLFLTGTIGAAATVMPISARIIGAALVSEGIPLESLDPTFGGDGNPPVQMSVIAPFLGVYFLSLLGLAFGLWRTEGVPLITPVLLLLGTIAFPIAESPFEVIEPVYLAATLSWLIGFGALAMSSVSAARA